MSSNQPRLFWPSHIGPYAGQLHELVTNIATTTDYEELVEIVDEQIANIPAYPNAVEGKLRYKAYLFILLDLLNQRWRPLVRQGQLYLIAPDWSGKAGSNEEIQKRKEELRQSLKWERDAQFQRPAIREFVISMEKERQFKGSSVSIKSLFANSAILAQQLRQVAAIQNIEEQQLRILDVIKPYLQLVTLGARCSYTGFLLQDIWRYFRYTWATPYNSTPGRQMFYLVRDAGQAMHPVIGIAALGSSMVQLTVRDDEIGWTPKAVEEQIMSDYLTDSEATIFVQMLHKTLSEVLSDLATSDLVSEEELANPTLETIAHLAMRSIESRQQRVNLLRQDRENTRQLLKAPDNDGEGTELQDAIQQELYRSKRASVLGQLLQAKYALDSAGDSINTSVGLKGFWQTPSGQQAIKVLVRENKKRKVGINLMDIIVCGAIPPYNTLLGGKLVAMLLASPQIIKDYQEKYTPYASTIASQMKGADVFRDSQLVFLGTTSLYSHGSSQYNRISIPVPNSSTEQMQYARYGYTEGFGSVHFSKQTTNAVAELQEYVNEARLINNRFGEGVNPKLRKLRAGLAAVGLPAVDDFLRHRSRRIVYGLVLGRQSFAYLRGETNNPDYYFRADTPEEIATSTKYISQYWAVRWLLHRIQSDTFLEQVASFQVQLALVSREFRSSSPEPVVQRMLEL